MSKLVCCHCGQTRGRHQASSYNCPSDDGSSFSRSHKFALQIERVESVSQTVEREVAHRVFKNIEDVFGCFEFGHRTYTQAEIVDALALVKKGYGL